MAGGLAAWLGFTTPSALLMIAFAYGVTFYSDALQTGWLRGLKIAAVAVVAQAVWGMAVTLCPDRNRASLALTAAAVVLIWPSAITQVAVILLSGILGYALFRTSKQEPVDCLGVSTGKRLAVACLTIFCGLFLGLPLLANLTDNHAVRLVDSFYRSGSLVFGGGHVVLPLLQAELVPPGWLSDDTFLAGYGAAQAVPGPLFTFAAYLGAAMEQAPNGWLGGMICLLAVFLPSLLLVLGLLPFWELLRAKPAVQSALRGTNAAVVGLLLAALYDPVWTKGIHSAADVIIGLGAFGLLQLWKVPSWLVVAIASLAGYVFV